MAFEDTWLCKTSEGAPGEVTSKLLKHQFLWRKTCYFIRSWHLLYYRLFVTINWNAKVNEIYKNKHIHLHQARTRKLTLVSTNTREVSSWKLPPSTKTNCSKLTWYKLLSKKGIDSISWKAPRHVHWVLDLCHTLLPPSHYLQIILKKTHKLKFWYYVLLLTRDGWKYSITVTRKLNSQINLT